MKTCSFCGASCGAADRFCTNCGTDDFLPVAGTKKCGSCGAECDMGVRFCTSCGAGNFSAAIPAAAPEPPQHAAPAAPPPQGDRDLNRQRAMKLGVETANLEIHLEQGTLLRGNYVIGQVLGSGGFGATYSAWDNSFERKVAVKEYMPAEFATRAPGKSQVLVFNDAKKQKQFHDGFVRFLDEGRRMSGLASETGLLHVIDVFEENGTAYLVMEHMDGELLQESLGPDGSGRVWDAAGAVDFVLPLMKSMQALHDANIFHLDISPSNVFVKSDGQAKFIDYAAYRHVTTSHSRSLSVIVKSGYSPEELYRSAGDLGAHTDVYATGALMYRMLTGRTPPDAMERRMNLEKGKADPLKPIRRFNKGVSKNQESAILNAMNVRLEDRTATMAQFCEELLSPKVRRRGQRVKFLDIGQWPLKAKAAAISAAAALVAALGLLFSGFFDSPLPIIAEGLTNVPNVINFEREAARAAIEGAELVAEFGDAVFHPTIEAGRIYQQDPPGGRLEEINTVVRLTPSNGQMMAIVPHLFGVGYEEAAAMLEGLGFHVTPLREFSREVPEGDVFHQDAEAGSQLALGSFVTLRVSAGRDPLDPVSVAVMVPDLAGMSIDEARALALEGDFLLSVAWAPSDEPAGTILNQSPSAGSTINPMIGELVEVSVSRGSPMSVVPNVVDMQRASAVQYITAAGFEVSATEEHSDSVAGGNVIRMSPEPNATLVRGSTVNIVVSLGQAPFAMPNVVGMGREDARRALQQAGLTVIENLENHPTVADNNVFRQSPEAGQEVSRGGRAYIVVSTGADVVSVPGVVGRPVEEARGAITGGRLTVTEREEHNDQHPAGTVFRQRPESGTVAAGTPVELWVSLGRRTMDVPHNMVGASGAGMENSLRGMGFAVATEREFSEQQPEGLVVRHDPPAGTTVHEGSLVTLVVSRGPQPVEVPDLIGRPSADASATLAALGFNVVQDRGNHATIPTGSVMAQSPLGRTLHPRGADVLLTVSEGPLMRAITFNSNGGSGTMRTLDVPHNMFATLPLNAFSPPTGMVFDSWNTDPRGNGAAHANGAQLTRVDRDITLYAQWRTGVTHNIAYHPNGAAGQTRTFAVLQGSSHTILNYEHSDLGFAPQPGHTFRGWTDAPGSAAITHLPGGSFNVTRPVSLYAVWEGPPVTITYSANGGQGQMGPFQVRRGETHFVQRNTFTHPRGYIFQGFSLTATGPVEFRETDAITNVQSDMTLHAVWTPPQVAVARIEGVPQTGQVNVPLALSGTVQPAGAGVPGPVVWTLVDGNAAISGNSITATAPGAATVRATIVNGVSTTPPVNFTQDFTITFAAPAPVITGPASATGRFGQASNQQIAATGIGSGTTFALAGAPQGVDITSTGLLQWGAGVPAGSHTFSITATHLGQTSQPFQFTLTIARDTFTVTYNVGTVSGAQGMPAPSTVLDGEIYTVSSAIPTHNDWDFQHWTRDGTQVSPGSQFPVSANVTLVAVWQPAIREVDLIFDANGGTGGPAPVRVTQNTAAQIPPQAPSRPGHDFLGWNTNPAATAATHQPGGSFPMGTADATLFAVWREIIPEVELRFDANGGTGGPAPVRVNINTPAQIPQQTPTRPGFDFAGWNTDPAAAAATHQPGGSFSMGASDATLYAVWTAQLRTFTVSYHPNGGQGSMPPEQAPEGTPHALSPNQFTRAGWTFQGWAFSQGSAVVEHLPQAPLMVTADITLFAVWQQDAPATPPPSISGLTPFANASPGDILPFTVQGGTAPLTVTVNVVDAMGMTSFDVGWRPLGGNSYQLEVDGNIMGPEEYTVTIQVTDSESPARQDFFTLTLQVN